MNEKIIIKTENEIDLMRKAGKIAAEVLKKTLLMARPGISTLELNNYAENEIIKQNGLASFKNFNGYPKAICVSINNEIVHGIPSNRKIASGDVVGIDLGVYLNGYHSDTATTVIVGNVSKNIIKLVNTTKKALDEAIKIIKPGILLSNVSKVIYDVAKYEGLGVIRDLTGHGIGKSLQEPPRVLNYETKHNKIVLQKGMCLAIEPMFTLGSSDIKVLSDGWTIVTADHSISSHFEHTIVITEKGCEILTKE